MINLFWKKFTLTGENQQYGWYRSQNNLSASSNDAAKSDDGYGDIVANECHTEKDPFWKFNTGIFEIMNKRKHISEHVA